MGRKPAKRVHLEEVHTYEDATVLNRWALDVEPPEALEWPKHDATLCLLVAPQAAGAGTRRTRTPRGGVHPPGPKLSSRRPKGRRTRGADYSAAPLWNQVIPKAGTPPRLCPGFKVLPWCSRSRRASVEDCNHDCQDLCGLSGSRTVSRKVPSSFPKVSKSSPSPCASPSDPDFEACRGAVAARAMAHFVKICWLLAAGCWALAAGLWLLAAG